MANLKIKKVNTNSRHLNEKEILLLLADSHKHKPHLQIKVYVCFTALRS